MSSISQSYYNNPVIKLPSEAVDHNTTLMILPMYNTGVGGYNNMNSGNVISSSNCNVELLSISRASDGHMFQGVYRITEVKQNASFSIVSQGSGSLRICILYLD